MEPLENEKQVIADRATQLDSGATPIVSANVALDLPYKPDPMARQLNHAFPGNWSFSELLSQKKLVTRLKIDTSTSAGYKVWNFVHTFDNVLDLHMRTMRKFFRIWRWNLHFLFEFRSNFQQVGQMLIVNHTLPQGYISTLLPYGEFLLERYFWLTQLPHVKVPMGSDNDVHCTLQWNAPEEGSFGTRDSYLYQNSLSQKTIPYDMGEIFLTVPFPMQIANNVNPNLYVTVWSWLTDLQFSGYQPEDGKL